MVVKAGVRPNEELGEKTGLQVNRGIVVDDYMETSNAHACAVRECLEHNVVARDPWRSCSSSEKCWQFSQAGGFTSEGTLRDSLLRAKFDALLR